MKRFLERLVPPIVCGAALSASAVDVHLTERTIAGGETNVVRETVAGTGTNVVSSAAPSIADFLFTRWSLSTSQPYSAYDSDGRAYDALSFVLYEDTTLTAHYLPEGEDADGDGVPDGWEWYWYGGMLHDADTDTDGDGYDFAAELAAGINPLLQDAHTAGVVLSDGEVLYNPNGWEPYTIRSEPEGSLFDTISDYVAVGTRVFTPTGDCQSTAFAYWTQDGAEVRDADGRALDYVVFSMPDHATELVAHTETDDATRMALYWNGAASAPADADGDGYSFAQEIAAGLNPNFADEHTLGVFRAESGLLDYNPLNLQRYVIRSEPEGGLFETISDFAEVGAAVTTPACDPTETTFAYWTQDGAEMRDGDGRAFDRVTFPMPAGGSELVAHTETNESARMALYWSGAASAPEDADGDGYSFAQELAAGLNPNLADSHVNGVVWADGDTLELNLQVYEQAQGALLDGLYRTFFSSPVAGTDGETFGANAASAILDWNGDGKRDLAVAFAGGIRVFVNNGTPQNPDLGEATVPENLVAVFESIEDPLVAGDGADALYFASRSDTNVWKFALDDGTISNTGKTGLFGVLEGELALLSDAATDVPLKKGVSIGFADADGDGAADLLASDEDGRIWLYRRTGERYVLQHKVWGGSHEGFADGLKLAPTDWDDDGDLDCVCGTAEGRLMLLSDPRGGRPANVTLSAGADTVSIKWDPQAQSRIRGYCVYRREQGGGTWEQLEPTTLPRFLDKPPEGADAYEYRVTSVSRFYTTGNSKPTTVESAATDPLAATLAKVAFTWRPAAGFAGDDVTVDFAVENAMNLSASGLVLRISYDPAVLAPVEVVRTGLTEDLEFVETRAAGSWLVSGTGGSIAPGTGKFLSFTFAVADAQAVAEAQVTVEEFTLRSVSNRNVLPDVPRRTGELAVTDFDPDDASQVPAGSHGDLDGDGRLGWNDVELFLRWKDAFAGDVPEAVRLAGDYNGDGRLDNRDYLLMRRHYRACEKRGGRMTGWDENHGNRGAAE